MEYWVAKDKSTLQIIGLTGIYTEIDDDEGDCWLGWFCVDKKYRDKKFGKILFAFSIEQAKIQEKKYLHIYTYNSKRYQKAIKLYQKSGFIEYNVKDTKYKKDLYFKRDLI